MSVARYGNAPLPPPSPSRDVTPRSRTAALHVAFSPRLVRQSASPDPRGGKRETSPPVHKPESPRPQ